MNTKKNAIRYGDYIFVKLNHSDSSNSSFTITANGFYSGNIWAGEEINLGLRSFRSCLFQIFPSQHIAKDPDIKMTETQFNFLKFLNPDNKAGTHFFGDELKFEKLREAERAEKVEFLNQKEISESFGHPVFYGGKFTLRHVENGMFLESSSKTHPFAGHCQKIKLTHSPSSEMYFGFLPSLAHRSFGEEVLYGEPVLISTIRLNNYLHFAEVAPLYTSLDLNSNSLVDTGHFPAFPQRRPEPYIENKTSKVVGCSLASKTATLVNYHHSVQSDFLKTGDYIRIFHDKYYFTIHDLNDQNRTRIWFESFESAEYRYQLVNTIFQIIRIPNNPRDLPREEIVKTVHSAKIEATAFGNKKNELYLLRHFATGKYLALFSHKEEMKDEENQKLQNVQFKLIEISDLDLIPEEVLPYIQIVADTYEGFDQVHKSGVFRVRYVGKNLSRFITLEDTPNVTSKKHQEFKSEMKNHVPEDYLIDKLRPSYYNIAAQEKLDILRSALKYSVVPPQQMNYILKAESLANKFSLFIHFCSDFKTPYDRKQISDYEEKKKHNINGSESHSPERTARSRYSRYGSRSKKGSDKLDNLVHKFMKIKPDVAASDHLADANIQKTMSTPGSHGKNRDKEFSFLNLLKFSQYHQDLDDERQTPESASSLKRRPLLSHFANPRKHKDSLRKIGTRSEQRKKRRRKLAKALQEEIEEDISDKIGRESLSSLAEQMNLLCGYINDFITEGATSKSEELPLEGASFQATHTLDKIKQWVVREFRILELVNLILHQFICGKRISTLIKEIRTRYDDYEDFQDFDLESFEKLVNALVELLMAVTKKNELNLLYNCQYVQIYLHICLNKPNKGLYSLFPLANFSNVRDRILSCCKTFLSDDDPTTLNQLNHYQTKIFEAIQLEEDYKATYIQLLDIHSRSKAPNLNNRIIVEFVRKFLINEKNLLHVFPELIEQEDEIIVKFTCYSGNPDLKYEYNLVELFFAYGASHLQGKLKVSGSITNKDSQVEVLASYLNKAFNLIDTLSHHDDMLFSLIVMKHYPSHLLQAAAQKLALVFPPLSHLIETIKSNIHSQYVKPPLQNFPKKITLISDENATITQITETSRCIKESADRLITDIEWEAIGEMNVEGEVRKSKELFDLEINQGKSPLLTQKNAALETMLTRYEAALHTLTEVAKDPTNLENKEAVGEALECLSTLESFSVKNAVIEILEAVQNVLRIKKPINADSKLRDTSVSDMDETITQDPLISESPLLSKGILDQKVISDITRVVSEKWKNPSNCLKSSAADAGAHSSQKSLESLLFNLLSLEDPTILQQAVSKLRWVSSFENHVYRELKICTIVSDPSDLSNVLELMEIRLVFNEYSRIFKIPGCFGKSIPEARIEEIFADTDIKINRLLFIIYNTKKHFRYPKFDSDSEERFLKGFKKWKTPTKDKPFKLNPEAINKIYQKIYLAIDIPKSLLQIIEIAVSMTESKVKDETTNYRLIIRKAVIILQIIIYKNTENQNSLSKQRFMISNLYNPAFTNQTCDFMILFSEMMRDNRQLLKLPMKYLNDITWAAFLNINTAEISEEENNAYLTTMMMSLHLFSKTAVGGKDPFLIISQKFKQMIEVLTSPSNGLDIFELWELTHHTGEEAIAKDTRAIDLPFHYYSIRELLSSCLEIKERILKNSQRVGKIFGQFKVTQWYNVLNNPSLLFQFEIRNLVCKTLTYGWYGGKYKLKPFEKFNNFISFVFRLFADISAFIAFMSWNSDHKELSDYQLGIQPGSLFSECSMVLQMQNMLEVFQDLELSNTKLQIYIEDIDLINLWNEYIYEGCIGLLNAMLIEEPNYMTDTIDFTDPQFSNLISYYLYLLQKLTLIPLLSKKNLISKIQDDLTKISLFPEYKQFKDQILAVTQSIREVSPKLRTREMTKIKFSNELHVYDETVDAFLRNRKQYKEYSIRKLADTLASMPDPKKIIGEIIMFLRAQYNSMKSSELIFLMKLLRKIIERENTAATSDEPVHTWEIVNIADLQKMSKIQTLYRELGLTELLVNIVLDRNRSKIMIEFLQLGLAYLYGGNSEVQEEFFQIFRKDYDNRVIVKLKSEIEKHSQSFKEFERIRVRNLYQSSIRYGFEYFGELQRDSPRADENSSLFVVDEQLFANIRENFNEDLFKNTQELKCSRVLILILSFIQGLAEKQCKNLQDFFRYQRFIDEKGEERTLANSFNFLCEFRTLFNMYHKVHCAYNNAVGDKILDVLTEFLQGDVRENMENLLNKTLLFDMCRLLTDYNSAIHLLPRGFAPNPYSGEFQALKSRVIQFLKTLAEYPDLQILQRVEKHLDLNGLLNIYEAIMFEFFGWSLKDPPTTNLYEITQQKIYTMSNEDYDGILMDGSSIYIIFRYLWEDSATFEKNIRHLIHESNRDTHRKEALEVLIFSFSTETIRGVEILLEDKQKDLIKYWFPKLPVCYYLLESSKQAFSSSVDRSSPQSKISSLMEASEEFISQMRLDYNSRGRFLGLNFNQFYKNLRVFSNILSLVINANNIMTLRYREGVYEFYPSWGEEIQDWLNRTNIVASIALVILWFLASRKRYLSVMWERFSDAFAKEIGALPQTIERKLDEERYSELDKHECLMLLKFKGIESEEFALVRKYSPFYSEIQKEILIQNVKFVIFSSALLWHMSYLGLSLGSLASPIFSAILIADIAVQSDAIGQVIKAVSTNWRQFLWTLFLLLMFALIYTFIGFYMLQDEFKDEAGNALCQDALGCFLAVLNLGLRSGGGIADAIQLQAYNPEYPERYFLRVVFSLAFFITMITILLNLIFGMIIDAFGDLRDTKTANEEDAKNVCFICGMGRSEFERYMKFDEHADKEHNYWSYIYLIVYIQAKFKTKRTSMTGLENFVNERFRMKDYSWVPVGRSLSLERRKEAHGTKRSENDDMRDTVNSLVTELKNFKDEISSLREEMSLINEKTSSKKIEM